MAIVSRGAAVALLRRGRKALGLDVSPSRVGLAVSDPSGSALPLGTIRRKHRGGGSEMRDIGRQIAAAATRHGVCVLAVGWPLEPSGAAGERCEAVRDFVDAVRRVAQNLPPVVFVDERFTTQAARHQLSEAGASLKHGAEDSAAAALILETLLDGAPPPSRFFDPPD